MTVLQGNDLTAAPVEVTAENPTKRAFGTGLRWAGALALLWMALNPGDHKSWVIGLPVVAGATAAALGLHSATSRGLSAWGALRFLRFFLRYSFQGGWDVARRAFSPAMPLNPALLTYRLRLREEHAQVLFINVISLLPGTVSVGLENGFATLHALDGGPTTLEETKALEERIAELFRLRLEDEGHSADE